MIAVFDKDGACRVVSDCPGEKGVWAEVPFGTRPEAVWWDGKQVRTAAPDALPVPAALAVGERFETELPKNTVADVNGKRQRGRLVLRATEPGALHISIRGARFGSYVVPVLTYADRRKAEYPPIGDQLDALWKALGDGGHPEASAMIERIKAVKAAHPKE